MRNYILVLFVLLFISCKTTPEDYSAYPFIDQEIRSEKYETYTLIPQGYELRSVYGHRYPSSSNLSGNIEKTLALPFILFDKKLNTIFFFSTKEDKYTPFTIKYNFEKNKIDTISYNGDTIRELYDKKKSDLTNFKFSEAKKYYKVVNREYHSEISEEKKKRIFEEYKNSSEETKQDIIKTFSIRYNTLYVELQMPNEKIHFKFSTSNDKIIFFGNEELYKMGYIYIYIYDNLNMFPHSGGLYVIRPKEKK
ncbi:hypothetical protein O2K51_14490 [Apibacter raozihei]|uniref:hypothetical protein n=1 Tax=Apibacter raozihei TaxID=2500547 RepID=UPI000FE3162A|nr:hypothetical protein [Apibacter raozihei]